MIKYRLYWSEKRSTDQIEIGRFIDFDAENEEQALSVITEIKEQFKIENILNFVELCKTSKMFFTRNPRWRDKERKIQVYAEKSYSLINEIFKSPNFPIEFKSEFEKIIKTIEGDES